LKLKINQIVLFVVFVAIGFCSCKAKQIVTEGSSKPSADDSDYYVKREDRIKEIQAEIDEDIEKEDLVLRDRIYKDGIQSVLLYLEGDQLSYPVIYLGSNAQLELHFDDLNGDLKTYNFEFIHCDANWEPSRLLRQEYLGGFFNGFIEEFEYSFNTKFPYIHYSLKFPNEEFQFKKSGNYVIKVYDNNDPNDVVLTRRFFVVDQRITIKANIHLATLARHMDYKQELDFSILLNNYEVQDPYSNLKVILMQNRRTDNTITQLKPLFISSNELSYNYEEENLFDGGNEYRFFDAKDFRYQSLNVDGLQLMNGKWNLFVIPEEPRSFRRYYYQDDLNGRRLIKRNESNDVHRESDYMITHFTLNRESELPNGDVYVFGALSDWQFDDKFKMKYDEAKSAYGLKVLLKQGYYNYSYAFLPNGSIKGDIAMIEGTHSATENDYYFFVYHRKIGEVYDRLIGFDVKNTLRR